MYTQYPDGFTEALIRNLSETDWEVATLDLSFDAWSPSVPDALRLSCPSPLRLTLACHPDRGVLLIDALHVPLASEISWTIGRLDDIEEVLRDRLPAEHRDSALLASGVALYADSDFDMVPDETRLALVADERRPQTVLDTLASRLFDEADPDEVYELFESLRQLGEWRSREDWIGRYEERVPVRRTSRYAA